MGSGGTLCFRLHYVSVFQRLILTFTSFLFSSLIWRGVLAGTRSRWFFFIRCCVILYLFGFCLLIFLFLHLHFPFQRHRLRVAIAVFLCFLFPLPWRCINRHRLCHAFFLLAFIIARVPQRTVKLPFVSSSMANALCFGMLYVRRTARYPPLREMGRRYAFWTFVC